MIVQQQGANQIYSFPHEVRTCLFEMVAYRSLKHVGKTGLPEMLPHLPQSVPVISKHLMLAITCQYMI